MPRMQKKSAHDDYEGFVKKFEESKAKTTDDCFTPPEVYECVRSMVCERYGINPVTVIRPFYPGGDYENEDYEERVVIDNPPFSCITKIVRFYMGRGVKFWLFAPHLTLFAIARGEASYCITDSKVVYANGADVKTSFVTNLTAVKVFTWPDLRAEIKSVQKGAKPTKRWQKLELPRNVISSAQFGRFSESEVSIPTGQFVRSVGGRGIYGGGIMIPEDCVKEIPYDG